ncbi:hypothetical protein Bhyg_10859, partial [Pseudolycoriella hygida]
MKIKYLENPYPESPPTSSSRLVSIVTNMEQTDITTTSDESLLNETTTSIPMTTDPSDNATRNFYIARSNDATQQLNMSSSEETNSAEDDAYVVPIRTDEEAERLTLWKNENDTINEISSTTDDNGDLTSTSPVSPVDILVNENGDQFDQINQQTI